MSTEMQLYTPDFFQADSTETSLVGYIPDNPEKQRYLINALSNTKNRLANFVNMTLNIENFYIERIQITDKDTGEVRPANRVVLIDTEGDSYGASSSGVFNSLKHIVMFRGTPDKWSGPLKIKVCETNIGTNRLLSLELVG